MKHASSWVHLNGDEEVSAAALNVCPLPPKVITYLWCTRPVLITHRRSGDNGETAARERSRAISPGLGLSTLGVLPYFDTHEDAAGHGRGPSTVPGRREKSSVGNSKGKGPMMSALGSQLGEIYQQPVSIRSQNSDPLCLEGKFISSVVTRIRKRRVPVPFLPQKHGRNSDPLNGAQHGT